MRRRTLIVLMTHFLLLYSGCAQGDYHSISSVSGRWLEVKIDLNSNSLADLESHLHGFRATLDSFFSSPVAHLYGVNRPMEMQYLEAINLALENLERAASSGSGEAVSGAVLEIDRLLGQMQIIDTDFSNRSQLQYFQLFFFFSILVIGIILAMGGLFSGLRKARAREKQSLAFSRETVSALEHERERIARELHDTVAQDLFRLSFQVDTIDKTSDQKLKSRLCAEVIQEQKEIMQRVREICNSLIPPGFKHRGLANALQSLCHEFEQRTGIKCTVIMEEGLKLHSLDLDWQLHIFRIVQECLSNIQKHSGAAEASLIARAGDKDTLLIQVSDNGRGFSVYPGNPDSYAALNGEGKFGLWSMKERAASMSGSLSLSGCTQDKGQVTGTVVTLTLPAAAARGKT